jgi:hypothetical protein
VEFDEALARFGFARTLERGLTRGSQLFTAKPNRFMTYMVHTYEDGSALFTFEFAIADYLQELGLQVGTAEADNQFLYPREDIRGPRDGTWLTAAIERTEAALESVHLDRPDR